MYERCPVPSLSGGECGRVCADEGLSTTGRYSDRVTDTCEVLCVMCVCVRVCEEEDIKPMRTLV